MAGLAITIARASRVDSPGRSGVGQVIAGRYTLREVLGEGGMGTDYRADQTAPVKRQVALNPVKIGMDSRAALARLDAERQALALVRAKPTASGRVTQRASSDPACFLLR